MKKSLVCLFLLFAAAAFAMAAPSLTDKVSNKMKQYELVHEIEIVSVLFEDGTTEARPAVRVGDKTLMGYGSAEKDIIKICVSVKKGKQCVLPDFVDDSSGFFFIYVNRPDVGLHHMKPRFSMLFSAGDAISRLENTYVWAKKGDTREVTLVGENSVVGFYSIHTYTVKEDKNAPVGTPLFGIFVDESGTLRDRLLLGFKSESGVYEFFASYGDVVVTDFSPKESELEDADLFDLLCQAVEGKQESRPNERTSASDEITGSDEMTSNK